MKESNFDEYIIKQAMPAVDPREAPMGIDPATGEPLMPEGHGANVGPEVGFNKDDPNQSWISSMTKNMPDWFGVSTSKGVGANDKGIATGEEDLYEKPMNPDGSDPSVFVDGANQGTGGGSGKPDAEPGWMENLTNWAGDNPGTAIGGVAGLGLGLGGLMSGNWKMGLLGAGTPILGYLYDQYNKTGRFPWQDAPGAGQGPTQTYVS